MSDPLQALLDAALANVSRNTIALAWVRGKVKNRHVPTDDITTALRALGWLPSPMKQHNGLPKFYFREDEGNNPAMKRLQAKLAERSARLHAANRWLPPDAAARREELALLGRFISGEPQARSRRRAALERSLKPLPGHYGDMRAVPTDLELIRAEIEQLGPYQLGEPGRDSRRRALLHRTLESMRAPATSRR